MKSEKPPEPLSYREMVAKILSDSCYAKEIHKLVRDARKEGQKGGPATDELNKRFKLLPKERDELELPPDILAACFLSNNTTFMLLDFAKMLPDK